MSDFQQEKLSGKRKAAIFLVSMGADISAEIFKTLKDDEVEALTFEIAKLKNIEPELKENVLSEFRDIMAAHGFIHSGGLDYAREVLEKSLGSQRAVDLINKLMTNLKSKPLDSIKKADPSYIFNFIQQEHPQTISLILAFLEPQNASVILSQLPKDIQIDVAKRISSMDRTSPDVLREVERVLEKKLSAMSSEDYANAGGIFSVVNILNMADRQTERLIVEALEEEDPELAEEIKKKMFVFEDIVLLDDKSIQTLLREIDMAELPKALKGVDEEVQNKIFKNISKRQSTMIKEEIDFMPPVRRKEIEDVQQKIVAVIRKLEEKGDIIISRGGDEDSLV